MKESFKEYRKRVLNTKQPDISHRILKMTEIEPGVFAVPFTISTGETFALEIPGGTQAIPYISLAIKMCVDYYWDEEIDGNLAAYDQSDYTEILSYLEDRGAFRSLISEHGGAVIAVLSMITEILIAVTPVPPEKVLQFQLESFELVHDTLRRSLKLWKNLPVEVWESFGKKFDLISDPLAFIPLYISVENVNLSEEQVRSNDVQRHRYMNWISSQIAAAVEVERKFFLVALDDLSNDAIVERQYAAPRSDLPPKNSTRKERKLNVAQQLKESDSMGITRVPENRQVFSMANRYSRLLQDLFRWLSVASTGSEMKTKSIDEMQQSFAFRQSLLNYFLDLARESALPIQEVIHLFWVFCQAHSIQDYLKQFHPKSDVHSLLEGISGELLMGLHAIGDGYSVSLPDEAGERAGEDLRVINTKAELLFSLSIKAFRFSKRIEQFDLPEMYDELSKRLARHPQAKRYLETAKDLVKYAQKNNTRARFVITPWFFGINDTWDYTPDKRE